MTLNPLQKTQLILAMLARGYNPIGAYNEANGPNAERYYQEYVFRIIEIGDIFIGNFPVTQKLGENPAMYKPFGLKGHNGDDFGCPTGTTLLACANGIVYRTGKDVKGYGNYVYIWDKYQKALFLYAHLKSISVKANQIIRLGQLLGYSNNTGNSTGPHLHFGVYKTDDEGNKLDVNNGYGGAIEALDKKLVKWVLNNPKKAL